MKKANTKRIIASVVAALLCVGLLAGILLSAFSSIL